MSKGRFSLDKIFPGKKSASPSISYGSTNIPDQISPGELATVDLHEESKGLDKSGFALKPEVRELQKFEKLRLETEKLQSENKKLNLDLQKQKSQMEKDKVKSQAEIDALSSKLNQEINKNKAEKMKSDAEHEGIKKLLKETTLSLVESKEESYRQQAIVMRMNGNIEALQKKEIVSLMKIKKLEKEKFQQHAELQQKIKKKDDEIQQLEKDNKGIHEELAKLNAQFTEITKTLETKEAQLTAEVINNMAQQEELKRLESEIDGFKARFEEAKKEVAEDIKKREENKKRLEDHKKMLEDRIQALHASSKQYIIDLHVKNKENQEVKATLNRVKNELQLRNQELNKKVSHLQQQNANQNRMITALKPKGWKSWAATSVGSFISLGLLSTNLMLGLVTALASSTGVGLIAVVCVLTIGFGMKARENYVAKKKWEQARAELNRARAPAEVKQHTPSIAVVQTAIDQNVEEKPTEAVVQTVTDPSTARSGVEQKSANPELLKVLLKGSVEEDKFVQPVPGLATLAELPKGKLSSSSVFFQSEPKNIFDNIDQSKERKGESKEYVSRI